MNKTSDLLQPITHFNCERSLQKFFVQEIYSKYCLIRSEFNVYFKTLKTIAD